MLGLQLPMQSVPITTKVMSSNHAHGEVYCIQHYVMKFVSDLQQDTSTHKSDGQDIAEILLKEGFNTITLPQSHSFITSIQLLMAHL